jgi:hypothetical protein
MEQKRSVKIAAEIFIIFDAKKNAIQIFSLARKHRLEAFDNAIFLRKYRLEALNNAIFFPRKCRLEVLDNAIFFAKI